MSQEQKDSFNIKFPGLIPANGIEAEIKDGIKQNSCANNIIENIFTTTAEELVQQNLSTKHAQLKITNQYRSLEDNLVIKNTSRGFDAHQFEEDSEWGDFQSAPTQTPPTKINASGAFSPASSQTLDVLI